MGINSTPEEKEQFKALNRLRMKSYRDKTRKLKYAPRGKYRQCLTCPNVADSCVPEDQGSPCGDKPEKNIDCVQTNKEEKSL